MRSLNSKQQKKILEALNNGLPLIDEPRWEQKIMSLKMTETKGLTNAQIIKKIRAGGDGGPEDGDIDIDVTGYYTLRGTVGYTYLNTVRTWFNTRFLDKYSAGNIYGHLLHEYCHRISFTHNQSHDTSVPYRVGYACTDIYNEYYDKNGRLKIPLSSGFMKSKPSLTFSIVS